MAEPFTIYKLTILYMLSKAGFPLSNTQISNFFLEQEYTDYFRVQEVIGDLVDANLIHAESTHSNTQYSLTSAGKETLGFFKDKLNDGIENDVQGFFEKNKLEFRQENSILADYYKTTNQKYAVRCQVRSDGNPLIDLTLCVTTKEQAEAICNFVPCLLSVTQLGAQLIITYNRARDQLREKRHIGGKRNQAVFHRHGIAVDIHHIGHHLKRVKRDAERQRDRPAAIAPAQCSSEQSPYI